MDRITSIVAGLLLAFVGTSATIADTINVPGDQPTIAAAISASVNGDVINIAAGTYNEYDLNPDGKAITIQGTLNGDGSLATTIDALQWDRVFLVNSGEGNGTVIQNLIITGGAATGGGGIFLQNSSATISGCTIQGNTGSYGGGIFLQNSSATISGCTITDNTANDFGGGISCNNSSLTISNCTISNNTSDETGGGIYCINSSPTISGGTISGNTAGSGGGGIYCYNNSSPTITDCRIVDNRVNGLFAFAGGGISSSDGSNPHLIGGTVSGNTNFLGFSANISGTVTQGLRGEQSDLGRIILEDSTVCGTGEYHITGVLIEHRGENHISDCIDEGDLNGDGDVDANDLDSLHASLGICPHDIDHDGDTDVEDLLRFLDGYGTTCP